MKSQHADSHQLLWGIGLRLFTTFLITAMAACIHAVSSSVELGQIIFYRSAFALVPICLYMLIRNEWPSALRTRRPGLHVTRSLLGAFSMGLSFISLTYLPVANAQSLSFLAPVLSLPLAALLLGEHLPRSVVLATIIGFGGVIILLWDALQSPSTDALVGVFAGLFFALTMSFVRVHTKTMTATESSSTIAFYFALVASLVGLATLPFGWSVLTNADWALLTLAGLIGGIGHIASNEAVARAPVSTLAPYDFTGLIWALGFDILLFTAWPSTTSLLGAAIITGAALLVTFASIRSKPKIKKAITLGALK